MKSVRLSESHKAAICRRMVESSRYARDLKKYDEQSERLFFDVRDHLLGRYKESYLALPPRLQVREDGISIVKVPERFHCTLRASEYYPCPLSKVNYEDLPKALQRKILNYARKGEQLSERKRETTNKARRIVYSCTTTKQLLELMPEAKNYIPDDLFNKASQQLPAVTRSSVQELQHELVQ